MRWSELDLDGCVLSLPPARTKNKRPHVVPLAPGAVAVLKSAPQRARSDGSVNYIFGEGEGGFSGWSKAKAALDRRIAEAHTKAADVPGKSGGKQQPIAGWRLHDLRRTCATVMADRLGVQPHIVEAALNHVSGHKAGRGGRSATARLMRRR